MKKKTIIMEVAAFLIQLPIQMLCLKKITITVVKATEVEEGKEEVNVAVVAVASCSNNVKKTRTLLDILLKINQTITTMVAIETTITGDVEEVKVTTIIITTTSTLITIEVAEVDIKTITTIKANLVKKAMLKVVTTTMAIVVAIVVDVVVTKTTTMGTITGLRLVVTKATIGITMVATETKKLVLIIIVVAVVEEVVTKITTTTMVTTETTTTGIGTLKAIRCKTATVVAILILTTIVAAILHVVETAMTKATSHMAASVAEVAMITTTTLAEVATITTTAVAEVAMITTMATMVMVILEEVAMVRGILKIVMIFGTCQTKKKHQLMQLLKNPKTMSRVIEFSVIEFYFSLKICLKANFTEI